MTVEQVEMLLRTWASLTSYFSKADKEVDNVTLKGFREFLTNQTHDKTTIPTAWETSAFYGAPETTKFAGMVRASKAAAIGPRSRL